MRNVTCRQYLPKPSSGTNPHVPQVDQSPTQVLCHMWDGVDKDLGRDDEHWVHDPGARAVHPGGIVVRPDAYAVVNAVWFVAADFRNCHKRA